MEKPLLGPLASFFLLISCLAMVFTPASAQNNSDPYMIGASIIRGSRRTCPMFIGAVTPKSPAESVGLTPGDRLLAIDGKDLNGMDLHQVATLIRSDRPLNVTLKLWRSGKEFEVAVPREKASAILAGEGMKQAGPIVVPVDTTEMEITRMMEIENGSRPIVGRVFPLHYPLNPNLYYGGFEIFVFAQPSQVVVGGLERGPALRAGIHQGDVILSINGIDPRGKEPAELEGLFSSNQPRNLKLLVDRVSATKTINFQLEKVSDVLKENHKRLFDGELVPEGLADEDLSCFTTRPAK